MIVKFLSSLDVREIDDGNWQLLSPFIVLIANEENSITLTVPAGFKTDFASIPRLPIVYRHFGNRAHRPSIPHDYLYTKGGTEMDRDFADHVLRAAAVADGMSEADAEAMFLAVRAGGKSHFNYSKGSP